MVMSIKNLPNTLLTDLRSNSEILQTLAFERLMNHVWSFDSFNSSEGRLLLNNSSCIDELIELMSESSPDLQNKIAWLFGVLMEAKAGDSEGEVKLKIKAGISKYLIMIQKIWKSNNSCEDIKVIDGLIFLLGHFPEGASLISEFLSDCLGQDVYMSTNLDLIFSFSKNHQVRSQFLLAHQGAKACNQSFDTKLLIYKNVLACPECFGALNYSLDYIQCHACRSKYQWFFDMPNLIPKNCDEPEEYPESLVKIYETESRPRFIRVMGRDWSSLITKDREREYLNQFMHPVDGPILDVACGVGNSTLLLTEKFGKSRVIAIDYSAAMLQSCKKNIKGATVVRGSASALPISNNSLGAVNCSDALQALRDPQQAISELARCMLPGASLTGFTFLEAPWPYSYFQRRLHYAKRLLFSVEQIAEFLINSNLQIVDLTVIERAIFFTARKPFNKGYIK